MGETGGSTGEPRAEPPGTETLSSTLPATDGSARDDIPDFERDFDPIHIGRFVVLRKLGEGGMGVVYAAYDNELDRKLAIKLVRPERSTGDSRVRVRREAQAMARLSHPNVVQVYEVGDHDGQIYVAMEFVTGPTLAEWAAAIEPGPGRWRVILAKYTDAGQGLAAAHAAGIVHRDFKPQNAIVGEDGRVRVLDFGIARAPGPSAAESAAAGAPVRIDTDHPLSTPLTRTGALVGTPAYMSPEQFERRSVDARSDQFSFCVALYEALYGARPFAATTTAALVLEVLAGEVAAAPAGAAVPGWIREILLRGLAPEPDDRFGSMVALLEALANDPARVRRQRMQTAVIAAMIFATIVGSGWYARAQMRSADEAELASREARREEARARQRKAEAEAERDRALREAQASAVRALDTARVLSARSLPGDPTLAAALLGDIERPAQTPGWSSAAANVLQRPLGEQVLRGHEGRIVYLDESPDGRWLATASFDGTARVWALETGEATVLAHADQVIMASFSPDGSRVLTACRDGTAAIWPAPTEPGAAAGEPTILRGHAEIVWSAAFAPDGRRVVTASRDGTARVWDLEAPERPIVFEASELIVWWAEFSGDGRRIVAATGEGTVGVWSVDEPERPPIWLPGHTDSVGVAHFDGRGDRILSASSDGTARLFELGREGPRTLAILAHDDDVLRARFGPGELRVVTTSRDQTARLWTLDELGRLDGPPRVFVGFNGPVWTADISPDGRLLAAGGHDREVRVWPLEGGPVLELAGHSADVFRVRFSADGRRLVSASNDGTVRVWSTDWHAAARTLEGHEAGVSDLDGGGQVLVSAGRDGTVRVWPIFDPGAGPAATHAPTILPGHRGHVGVALSERPQILATGDEDGRVRLWSIAGTDVRAPDRPVILEAPTPSIYMLDLDASAELLVAGTSEGHVYRWRLPGGDPSRPIAAPELLIRHEALARSAAVLGFSPDSQALVSGGADGELRVWTRAALLGDAPQGRALAGHGGRLTHLAFSRDSRFLASTGLDGEVFVWALGDDAGARRALEAPGLVSRLAFDGDGERLLGAGLDAQVLLWELGETGPPRILGGPAGEVRDVAFGPGDRWIAAVALDGNAYLWSLDANGNPGADAIVFEAGDPLYQLEIVDHGRRLATAGLGRAVELWYLGEGLEIATLHERLSESSRLCLTVEQRMHFSGESRAAAEAGHAACVHE